LVFLAFELPFWVLEQAVGIGQNPEGHLYPAAKSQPSVDKVSDFVDAPRKS
jgi:hypothetical protein